MQSQSLVTTILSTTLLCATVMPSFAQTSTMQNRPLNYVPEAGYASTTDAIYIPPSITQVIEPNQKIIDYGAKGFVGKPVIQRLTGRTYWIGVGFYNTLAYVGDEGVLIMDAMAYGAGEGVLQAVASITDKPIRAIIYSHHHEDHIDDVKLFTAAAKQAGIDLRIIATEATAKIIHNRNLKLPTPTEILTGKAGSTKFENLTIQMTMIANSIHTSDSAAWKLVEEDVLHIPDVINPDQLPYLGFGGSLRFDGYQENLTQVRELGFKFFSGGHGNIGSMADFDFMETYVEDLKVAVGNSFTAASPADFSVPTYNNHHASAHAWFEAMNKVALDELRPKYGKFYGFEVSVPYQIRMVRDYLMD